MNSRLALLVTMIETIADIIGPSGLANSPIF
jgi:hypothetical protein